MNEKSLFRVLNFFSANLKSQVQNPKWVGIFAIVLTFVFGGVVMAQVQQRPKIARIGVLRVDARTSPAAMEAIDDFKRGLSNLGYAEGQNINFEIRGAENKLDRLPLLAAELVQLKVDTIVTGGPQATKATKEATNTIPIVMGRMDDVVEHGLVTSLARPGLSFQTGELSGKWLDLLKEVLPKLSRVAVLWDTSSTAGQLRTVEAAARSMGLHVAVSKVVDLKDFDFVFDDIRKKRMEGLIILGSPIFTGQRERLAELAAKQNLPAIYYHEGFAQAGGLLAYGPKQSEFSWHRAAIFVDKILKGAKPADLPVEQPTKFDFIINLKTAKQIGVTIPPNVLARADKVIR
jgi:putative tryptophan/tyrosine transport system substrate-binding protein